MKNNLKVFKFGGASVKDAEAIKNVANILKDYKGEPMLIVVSAIGKMTNAFELIVKAYQNKTDDPYALLETVKQAHYKIIMDLFGDEDEVYASVNDAFVEIEWILEEELHPNPDYTYDQIVSIGELVSTKILAAYLNKINLPTYWLDARDVILTDNIFRDSWVQWPETIERAKSNAAPHLGTHQFVLTQGFIGSTSENFTTTLGREGSDYSAGIFSFCLDAESMTIWKDVPGVLSADPTLFEHVIKLDNLSYREAIEMTYYGAKVIHPKTIKPLQNKAIPLFVKSFKNPNESGTQISSDVEDNYPPMVSVQKNQALLNISTKDFSFVAEHHMSHLFTKIAELRLHVNMMQNTALSFALCINNLEKKAQQFAESISEDFNVTIQEDLELIAIRHFRKDVVENLKKGKLILLEERIRQTVQIVVKDVPMLQRKAKKD